MYTNRYCRGAALLVLFAISVSQLFGQQSSARLLGTVVDQSGAVVPNATVSAVGTATGQRRTAQTDDSGNYAIPLLPIGEYTVSVEASGFKVSTARNVVLQVDQDARVDITLTLGSTSETVSVEALAPLLVTDNSAVGQVI